MSSRSEQRAKAQASEVAAVGEAEARAREAQEAARAAQATVGERDRRIEFLQQQLASARAAAAGGGAATSGGGGGRGGEPAARGGSEGNLLQSILADGEAGSSAHGAHDREGGVCLLAPLRSGPTSVTLPPLLLTILRNLAAASW